MRKILKRTAIAVLLLVGIPLLALLLINLRDEELDPAAAAFLKTEPPRLPDEQNAFYHLAGLGSAPSENPHAAGRTWFAQVHAAQAKQLSGEQAAWPERLQGAPKLPQLCSPDRGESCIRWLKEKPDARKLLAEHARLIERYRGLHGAERRRRIDQALELVGLSSRARHLPSQLSGGQQQRVAIARVLAGDPRLILADEPTGNLDSLMTREIMDLLEKINEQGTTIVMVTHSPECAARAQRQIHLLDGRVVDFELPAAALHDHQPRLAPGVR